MRRSILKYMAWTNGKRAGSMLVGSGLNRHLVPIKWYLMTMCELSYGDIWYLK
ncbi:MAG: hypothetical protein ACTSXF_08010 [Promethearchaeota archaeon]